MYKGLCFKSGEKENHQEEAGRKQEGVSDESRAAVTAHHKAGVNESWCPRPCATLFMWIILVNAYSSAVNYRLAALPYGQNSKGCAQGHTATK